MTVLLLGALAIGGLVVWGLMPSMKQRGIDRSHFATFVGFSASVVAVAATTLELGVAALRPHSMNPPSQGFAFVTGIIAIITIAVTFFAALFSRGTHRIALASCGIVISLMYLSGLVSHFGD